METTGQHYTQFATKSRHSWIHRPDYLAFWADRLVEILALTSADRILDLGAGRGELASALAERVRPNGAIDCVEPSSEMIARISDPQLRVIAATAQEHLAGTPDAAWDVVILKQVIHHIPSEERPGLYREINRALAPGGRVAILTMPETILYPMFRAAVRNFERGQIRNHDLEDGLRQAGFAVTVVPCDYPVRIGWTEFCAAVRERFISDLRPFSEAEIEQGLQEIEAQHAPGATMEFFDRLVVFAGRKAAAPGHKP